MSTMYRSMGARTTAVSDWLNKNFTLITAQILVLMAGFLVFKYTTLDKYEEVFDDHRPNSMLICTGADGDYSDCAPHILNFRSEAACARAAEDVFFGIKSWAHIVPHPDAMEGTAMRVNISCVPTDGYTPREPKKVDIQIHGKKAPDDSRVLKGHVAAPEPTPPVAAPQPQPEASKPAGPPAR